MTSTKSAMPARTRGEPDDNVVRCDGPDDPHAFDVIPLQERHGSLDAPCPLCRGHGQWNREIDLATFRSVREICPRCLGAGWIETGADPVMVPDIVLSHGQPTWTCRELAKEEMPRDV